MWDAKIETIEQMIQPGSERIECGGLGADVGIAVNRNNRTRRRLWSYISLPAGHGRFWSLER